MAVALGFFAASLAPMVLACAIANLSFARWVATAVLIEASSVLARAAWDVLL